MLIGILGLRRDVWQPLRESDSGDGNGPGAPDDGDPAGAGGAGAGDGEDVTGLKNALAQLRKDAKTSKTEIQRLTQELATAKGGGNTELEQAQTALKAEKDRADKAEASARETAGKVAVMDAAIKARGKYPETIWRTVSAQLDFDDDGKPTNAADLVADLRKQAPDLFRPADPGLGDAGAGRGNGNGGGSNDVMNNFIRRGAKRTTGS